MASLRIDFSSLVRMHEFVGLMFIIRGADSPEPRAPHVKLRALSELERVCDMNISCTLSLQSKVKVNVMHRVRLLTQ
jgi:hypothetical protein